MRRALAIFVLLAAGLAPTPGRAHDGLPIEIAVLDAQLVSRPSDVDLLVQRAALLRRFERLDRALADLDRAATLAPGRRDVWVERGLVHAARKEAAAAEADLDRFLASGPASSAALSARGALREASGRLAEARADYDAAVAIDPVPDLYLARGRTDEALGQLDRAAAGYAEGLQRLHGAVVLRLALVRVLSAQGRFDEAIARVDEAMASVPVKADWLLLRGEAHEGAGRVEAARRDRVAALAEIDALMKKRPTDLRRLSRARALHALRRWAEAKREVSAVLASSPSLVPARELSAVIDAGMKPRKKTP